MPSKRAKSKTIVHEPSKPQLEIISIAPPKTPISEPKPKTQTQQNVAAGKQQAEPKIAVPIDMPILAIAAEPIAVIEEEDKKTEPQPAEHGRKKHKNKEDKPPENFLFQAIGLISGILTRTSDRFLFMPAGEEKARRVHIYGKLRRWLEKTVEVGASIEGVWTAYPQPGQRSGAIAFQLRSLHAGGIENTAAIGQFKLSGKVIYAKEGKATFAIHSNNLEKGKFQGHHLEVFGEIESLKFGQYCKDIVCTYRDGRLYLAPS